MRVKYIIIATMAISTVQASDILEEFQFFDFLSHGNGEYFVNLTIKNLEPEIHLYKELPQESDTIQNIDFWSYNNQKYLEYIPIPQDQFLYEYPIFEFPVDEEKHALLIIPQENEEIIKEVPETYDTLIEEFSSVDKANKNPEEVAKILADKLGVCLGTLNIKMKGLRHHMHPIAQDEFFEAIKKVSGQLYQTSQQKKRTKFVGYRKKKKK